MGIDLDFFFLLQWSFKRSKVKIHLKFLYMYLKKNLYQLITFIKFIKYLYDDKYKKIIQ